MHSLGNYNRFKFSKGMWKRYQVWTNSQLANGGGARGGVGLLANDGATQCVGISRIIDSKLGESSPSGASTCSFSSDIREECESFISWLNTRFTRFFVAINISKLTGIINDDSFRFVPAPPTDINGKYKFDHIYTDQELYDYYKIPKQYQEVIESVIKERK